MARRRGRIPRHRADLPDNAQITATLFIHDTVLGTATCNEVTLAQGGLLVSTVYYLNPLSLSNPMVTAPAGTCPATRPLTWNVACPLPATGQLTIHIEPLTTS